MSGAHVAPLTRDAAIAEAQAKYRAAWDELKAQRAEAEAKGQPIHQQLYSMTGNAITRQLDEDIDAAMDLGVRDA